jgi:D-3-phosphoglycerate dehydrogenase
MNMKCVLIGDMFIPTAVMEKAAKDSGMFSEIVSIDWGPKNRFEMRNTVRMIETKGAYGVAPPQGIQDIMKGTDVIMVHLCPVQKLMIKASNKLKIIASTRGGVENIDVAAASKESIAVISNPAHNANAVAEYTVGLMLVEQRNIARSHYALKNKVNWREVYPNSENISEMSECTVGLLGLGSIGSLVAKKLSGFGCRLLVYDPYVDDNYIKEFGCDPSSLDKLLSKSDFVSMHMRLSEQTKGFMNKELFSKMKSTAYFINTARARLVDMEALYDALNSGAIMGAAIDVYEKEPISADLPLLALDNITLTNHRGGDTAASYLGSPRMVFEQVNNYFQKKTVKFLANAELCKK